MQILNCQILYLKIFALVHSKTGNPRFLSDPSLIFGYFWQWLTHSWFVDLTDVTLAFEDTNSKFLDIASFADDDAKECVDHS